MLQCPACLARYELPDHKVVGRSTRARCRRCEQELQIGEDGAVDPVGGPMGRLRREARTPSDRTLPDDFARWDFREVGLDWALRTRGGMRMPFQTVAELEELLARGEARADDEISFDDVTWVALRGLGNPRAWFWERWQRAEGGEITSHGPFSRTPARPVRGLDAGLDELPLLEPSVAGSEATDRISWSPGTMPTLAPPSSGVVTASTGPTPLPARPATSPALMVGATLLSVAVGVLGLGLLANAGVIGVAVVLWVVGG